MTHCNLQVSPSFSKGTQWELFCETLPIKMTHYELVLGFCFAMQEDALSPFVPLDSAL